jgi:hypothetical protein
MELKLTECPVCEGRALIDPDDGIECLACGYRRSTSGPVATCPRCGGRARWEKPYALWCPQCVLVFETEVPYSVGEEQE